MRRIVLGLIGFWLLTGAVLAGEMHTWKLKSGKTFDARFVMDIGDKLTLKTPKGRILKIPKEDISEEDINYVELANPPKFDITGVKIQAKSGESDISPYSPWVKDPLRWSRYRFGFKIKQRGANPYPHELKIEYFVFGKNRISSRSLILLDRGSATFSPTEENKRLMEYYGDREIELLNYRQNGWVHARGKTYAAILVIATDERGEIIAYKSPYKWLEEGLEEKVEKLREFPLGGYLNKEIERVYAPRPATPAHSGR